MNAFDALRAAMKGYWEYPSGRRLVTFYVPSFLERVWGYVEDWRVWTRYR